MFGSSDMYINLVMRHAAARPALTQVFLSGPEAEALAAREGLELVENDYFETADRRAQWAKYKANG